MIKKIILVSLVLIYFLFTSGFVFEAIQSKSIDQLDVPYSFALSGDRTGIVGIYKQGDLNCAEWLDKFSNQTLPIVADINGYVLLQGYIYDWQRIKIPVKGEVVTIGYYSITWVRPYLDKLPEHCYVFLTDWNIEHGKYIDARKYTKAMDIGPGLRVELDLPKFDYPVIFQSSRAVVLEK